jgi:diguanylate cyclase (GGDEF)-like protein
VNPSPRLWPLLRTGFVLAALVWAWHAAASPVTAAVVTAARVDDADRVALRDAVRWCLGAPMSDAPPAVCDRRNDTAGDLNAGYSERAVWIAVALRRDGEPASRWLEIAYPSLDHVVVHAPMPEPADGSPLRVVARVGDQQPYAARPLPNRGLVVPLNVPTGESTLWLRVDSQGTLTVPLTLWRPEAFAVNNQTMYALHAAYFGLLLGLSLFYLLLGAGLRDGVFLTYAVYGLCLGVGLAAQNGFGNESLWREWPALSNIALPIGMQATTGFGAWFVLRFLDLGARGGALALSLRALMLSCFAVGIPALLLDLPGSWPLVSINALLFCGVALAASIAALRRGVPAALPFLLAWLMLLAGALLTGLRNLGVVPTNAWTANALQIGSSLEMLLLAIALAARFAALRVAHAEGQAQLIDLKQQALEQAAQAEATLEARVLERTAELADANRRLRESEVQLRAMANRDVLTGVANRVALRHALEVQLNDWSHGGSPFAVLLLDLDGFKPVNDRHGHAVGDDVLVEIARRLCQVVRTGDLVARHGGDEFVLLLRSLHEDAQLEQRVRDLAEAVKAPIAIGDEFVVVKASIGVARAAHGADTVDGLLRRADLAMYTAKAQGSGRWSYAPAIAG